MKVIIHTSPAHCDDVFAAAIIKFICDRAGVPFELIESRYDQGLGLYLDLTPTENYLNVNSSVTLFDLLSSKHRYVFDHHIQNKESCTVELLVDWLIEARVFNTPSFEQLLLTQANVINKVDHGEKYETDFILKSILNKRRIESVNALTDAIEELWNDISLFLNDYAFSQRLIKLIDKQNWSVKVFNSYTGEKIRVPSPQCFNTEPWVIVIINHFDHTLALIRRGTETDLPIYDGLTSKVSSGHYRLYELNRNFEFDLNKLTSTADPSALPDSDIHDKK